VYGALSSEVVNINYPAGTTRASIYDLLYHIDPPRFKSFRDTKRKKKPVRWAFVRSWCRTCTVNVDPKGGEYQLLKWKYHSIYVRRLHSTTKIHIRFKPSDYIESPRQHTPRNNQYKLSSSFLQVNPILDSSVRAILLATTALSAATALTTKTARGQTNPASRGLALENVATGVVLLYGALVKFHRSLFDAAFLKCSRGGDGSAEEAGDGEDGGDCVG
jgi:hypothetical protein